jgi:TPR repeat protein
MYFNGRGVQQDAAEAVKWIIKAAEQGDVDAQYMLGVSYYGLIEGVPEDRVEAKKWLRKAAAQGCAEAQEFLNKVGW